MFKLLKTATTLTLFSSAAMASGGYGHHHGHHHGHHYAPPYYRPVGPTYIREEVHYYQQPAIVYQPAPVVPVMPPMLPPQHYGYQYQGYDRRTTQGLVGSAVGGMLGYELSNGQPVAAGIGAAAGALFGQGFRH